MTKSMTLGVGFVTLLLSWYGELSHSAFLSFFFDIHSGAAIVRASLVMIVCIYCLFGVVRNTVTQWLMMALGLTLLYTAVASLFTAHFYGASFSYYMLSMDIFLALEWGIITLLVALEQPVIYEINFTPILAPLRRIFKRPLVRNHRTRPA